MAGKARQKRRDVFVALRVSVPVEIPVERVRPLIATMLEIGFADAVETVRSGEGGLGNAHDAQQLLIMSVTAL